VSFDVKEAKELLSQPWDENECPRCCRTIRNDHDVEEVGVCSNCAYEMLDEALAALEAIAAERDDLRARIVAASKELEGLT
jgi:ribosomal protein L37AE/L43A